MFGIKLTKQESPKQGNLMENSRNYSLTRKSDKNKDEETGFLSIIRE